MGSRSHSDTLDASTFIDPFSESNPFADDDSIGPVLSTGGVGGGLTSSQSLNFNEYYPQSTIAATETDDDDEAGRGGSGGATEGSLYGTNTTFQKSFSAMNLAGQQGESTLSSSPYYGAGATSGGGFEDHQQRTSHQYDSDGGQRYATGGGGHQRWSSVDSDHHDETEESLQHQQQRQQQQQYQQYDQVRLEREGAGQYRPESTRSLGSQVNY